MTGGERYRGVWINKHGRRWRWELRHKGTRVRRSFETLGEARLALELYLAERAQAEERRRAQEAHRFSVRELCETWLRWKSPRIAPATAQQYEIHVRVHIATEIGGEDANVIGPRELDLFYQRLRWKPAKESHNILRQSFDWGIRTGVLVRQVNPCVSIRPSRRTSIDADGFFDTDSRMRPVDEKEIPTPAEVEKLLIDAESGQREAWFLYLKLASSLGARPGEICALQRQHFDLERRTVRIEWSADRVGGRIKRPKSPSGIRTLYLPASFFEEIQPLLPNDPSAFVFPSNTRAGAVSPLPCWNSRGVKRRLDQALQRTGIKHISPHAFRHFVATQLLAQGWPALQVARFLGHANDSLVRSLYANHIVDEAQRRIGEAAANLV